MSDEVSRPPINRCLGIDPGGVRMGWAIIGNPHTHFEPKYVASGVLGLRRERDGENAEPYQVYKLRLVNHFTLKSQALLMDYRPVIVVNETQPAVGGGNFIAATQAELAKTSAVIFQSAGYAEGIKVVQVAANTVKKTVTGDSKASKVKVRDAVIEHFPGLSHRKVAWQSGKGKEGFDESDAIAVALTYWLTHIFL